MTSSIKQVLVHLDPSPPARQRLQVAVRLTQIVSGIAATWSDTLELSMIRKFVQQALYADLLESRQLRPAAWRQPGTLAWSRKGRTTVRLASRLQYPPISRNPCWWQAAGRLWCFRISVARRRPVPSLSLRGSQRALLSRISDLGADLLVMGCYGHSRAREWTMGGASRTILATMTVPVLMAHGNVGHTDMTAAACSRCFNVMPAPWPRMP